MKWNIKIYTCKCHWKKKTQSTIKSLLRCAIYFTDKDTATISMPWSVLYFSFVVCGYVDIFSVFFPTFNSIVWLILMVSIFDIVLILLLLCSLLSAFSSPTPYLPFLHPILNCVVLCVSLLCVFFVFCVCWPVVFSFFLVPTLLLLVAPQAVDTGRAGRGLFCSSHQYIPTSLPPAFLASNTGTGWKCNAEIDRRSVGLWLGYYL